MFVCSTLIRRELGPSELNRVSTENNNNKQAVGLVPVYHTRFDSISSFPYKNSLSYDQQQQQEVETIVQDNIDSFSYRSTPPLFSNMSLAASSSSSSSSANGTYTTPPGLISIKRNNSNEQIVEKPQRPLHPQQPQHFPPNVPRLILSTSTQNFPLEDDVDEAPSTGLRAHFKSELINQRPQKPLFLPKLRDSRQLFETRSSQKRQSSTNSLLKSPVISSPLFFSPLEPDPGALRQTQDFTEPLASPSSLSSSSSIVPTPEPSPFGTGQTAMAYATQPISPLINQLGSTHNPPMHRITMREISSSSASTVYDLEKQRNHQSTTDEFGRPYCNPYFARLLLLVSILFPPLWLLIAVGLFDNIIGVVPKLEKEIALFLAVSFLCASITGIIVGMVIGLRHE